MELKRFHLDKLADYYEVEKMEKLDIGVAIQYKVKNDTFGFRLYNDTKPELVILIDNFPAPRLHYRSDLPIRTFEDLEYNLKQAGINLVFNPKTLVFNVKEALIDATEDDDTDEIEYSAFCDTKKGVLLFTISETLEGLQGKIEELIKDCFKNQRVRFVKVVFGKIDSRNFSFEIKL